MSDQKNAEFLTLNDLGGSPIILTARARALSLFCEQRNCTKDLRDIAGACSCKHCRRPYWHARPVFWWPGQVVREERRFRTAPRADHAGAGGCGVQRTFGSNWEISLDRARRCTGSIESGPRLSFRGSCAMTGRRLSDQDGQLHGQSCGAD